MAVSPRLIRRRIRSVANTKKITRAMEAVAAAKMRRAVAAALRTRAYANLARAMVESLRGALGDASHPLLRAAHTTGGGVLYVVMGSDRGLCGGFNAALFRALRRDVEARAGQRVLFITIGKKAEQFVRRQRWGDLVASYTNVSVAPTVAELRPVARMAMDAFTSSDVAEVHIAFTDFISSLRQEPKVRALLPLERIAEVGGGTVQEGVQTEFLLEPSPAVVLDRMLPRLVELQVYQAYLDTGASEHSARMLAMRSASDAASDMIDALTLTFNRARQAMITQEIAEISAGRAALGS